MMIIIPFTVLFITSNSVGRIPILHEYHSVPNTSVDSGWQYCFPMNYETDKTNTLRIKIQKCSGQSLLLPLWVTVVAMNDFMKLNYPSEIYFFSKHEWYSWRIHIRIQSVVKFLNILPATRKYLIYRYPNTGEFIHTKIWILKDYRSIFLYYIWTYGLDNWTLQCIFLQNETPSWSLQRIVEIWNGQTKDRTENGEE